MFALAWLADHPTEMFTASHRNVGASNRYGYSGAPESGWRFSWGGSGFSHLADFNATPGEHGATYLSPREQDDLLSHLRIPRMP